MAKFSNFIFTKSSNELLTGVGFLVYLNSLQWIIDTGYRIQGTDTKHGLHDV